MFNHWLPRSILDGFIIGCVISAVNANDTRELMKLQYTHTAEQVHILKGQVDQLENYYASH